MKIDSFISLQFRRKSGPDEGLSPPAYKCGELKFLIGEGVVKIIDSSVFKRRPDRNNPFIHRKEGITGAGIKRMDVFAAEKTGGCFKIRVDAHPRSGELEMPGIAAQAKIQGRDKIGFLLSESA